MQNLELASQPRMIRGCAREDGSRRPLAGVRVELACWSGKTKQVLAAASTDARGAFELPLSARRAALVASEDIRLVVRGLDGGGRGALELRLDRAQLQLGQLEVLVPLPIAGGPWIGDVSPKAVHPGSFVELHGTGFGDVYGDVTVSVGGREALVLEVQPTVLLVRIPPLHGALDPLVVDVAGQTVELAEAFEWAERPFPESVGGLGPPRTFGGVSSGTSGGAL